MGSCNIMGWGDTDYTIFTANCLSCGYSVHAGKIGFWSSAEIEFQLTMSVTIH